MAELEQKGFNEVPAIINANESHMALVFLLDTSGSMDYPTENPPIRSLNEGLNRFKTEVCENKQTRDILDVAIIEFNSNYRVVQEFFPVEYMETVNLGTAGTTVMSPAINKALDMVDERSRFYRRSGSEPYKPWVLMITDGEPDSDDNISAVAQRIKSMEDAGKVSFRSLGVKDANFDILHQLSGKKVFELEGTDFTAFFDWVNKSMRSVSEGSPSERPKAVDAEKNLTVHRSTNDWD